MQEDRAQWNVDQVEKFGLFPEEAAGLKMHCRAIAAVRIEDAGVPLGMVVFESEKPHGIRQSTVAEARGSGMIDGVAAQLSCAQPHFPAMLEHAERAKAA